MRLSYTSLLNTFPKLDIRIISFWLKFSPYSKILVPLNTEAMASDLPSYDIFVTQKVPLSKTFDDVIAGDFWFVAPTKQKSWMRL